MNNDKSQKTLGAAFATSVLAVAMMGTSTVASAASTERCADVTKAGKNSCAVTSLGISCSGHATEDNLPGAWIKVPVGTCASIVSICAEKSAAPEGTNEKKLKKACAKVADQTDESVAGGRLVDKNGEPI